MLCCFSPAPSTLPLPLFDSVAGLPCSNLPPLPWACRLPFADSLLLGWKEMNGSSNSPAHSMSLPYTSLCSRRLMILVAYHHCKVSHPLRDEEKMPEGRVGRVRGSWCIICNRLLEPMGLLCSWRGIGASHSHNWPKAARRRQGILDSLFPAASQNSLSHTWHTTRQSQQQTNIRSMLSRVFLSHSKHFSMLKSKPEITGCSPTYISSTFYKHLQFGCKLFSLS